MVDLGLNTGHLLASGPCPEYWEWVRYHVGRHYVTVHTVITESRLLCPGRQFRNSGWPSRIPVLEQLMGCPLNHDVFDSRRVVPSRTRNHNSSTTQSQRDSSVAESDFRWYIIAFTGLFPDVV